MIDKSLLDRSTFTRHVLAAFWASDPEPMFANEVAIRLGIPSGNFIHTLKRLRELGWLEYTDEVPEHLTRSTQRFTSRRRWLHLTDEGRKNIDEKIRHLSAQYEARTPYEYRSSR